jgi:ubiquinone/menaquinone biosynthesis C-methylase UbiE
MQAMGYLKEDLEAVPAESIMGLGCGNPVSIAEIQMGDRVLDLGCGGGTDMFLISHRVGPEGKAIGIDLTREMINKLRIVAAHYGYSNIAACTADIESLPFTDSVFDVVISNYAISSCPYMFKALSEAHRILKQGKNMVITDVVSEDPVNLGMKQTKQHHAFENLQTTTISEYLDGIRQAGFKELQLYSCQDFKYNYCHIEKSTGLVSITVSARKVS